MENYDLGRVFSRLFQMVSKCLVPTSGFIAAGVVAMGAIMALIFGSALMAVMATASAGPTAGPEAAQMMLASLAGVSPILLIGGYLVMIVMGSVLLGGIMDACLRAARGEKPTFSSCVSAGFANCLKLTGFLILWYLAMLVVLLVVGGGLSWLVSGWLGGLVTAILVLLYMAAFSPSIPALVNEKETGVFGAFGRGLTLSNGHLGMVVLTLVLWTLMYIVLYLVCILVLGLVGAALAMVSQYLLILMIIPYLALIVALMIFIYGTMASIYAELKLIKEGGDGKNVADVFS
ncbi:MAG: hypothetical protein RL367_1417 [Pseudomonadota bacterium]